MSRPVPTAAALALPVAALVFASSVAFARSILDASWERVMTHNSEAAPYARYRSFRAQLPRVVRAPNSAVVIGVCFSEKGLIPEEFDDRLARAHGRELTTFSIATASMHTTTLALLADTIAAGYRGAGTRPELVLVELSPSMVADEANEVSAGVPAGYNRALQALLVRDAATLARVAAASPARGVEAATSWALGGPTSAFTSELLCMHSLDRAGHCRGNAPAWWPWPGDDAEAVFWRTNRREWDRFVPALRRESGPRALSWSLARRGYIRRMPASMVAEHEAYIARRAPRYDAPYIADYNRYDREVIELFSVTDPPFRQFLAAIRALQALGAPVISYISPKANYLVAGPEDARLLQRFFDEAAALLAAIDVPLVQINSQRYTLPDFHGTWGLLTEQTAAPRFSRELADAIAEVLASSRLASPVARLLPAGPAGPARDRRADPFWRSEVAARE